MQPVSGKQCGAACVKMFVAPNGANYTNHTHSCHSWQKKFFEFIWDVSWFSMLIFFWRGCIATIIVCCVALFNVLFAIEQYARNFINTQLVPIFGKRSGLKY
jgi:hypothetical protein